MTLNKGLNFDSHNLGNLGHILIPPSTHINHQILPGSHLLRQLDSIKNSVTRLQRRNNTLVFAHHFESLQGFLVRHGLVDRPPRILEERVLRSNSRVIEPRRDGMGVEGLSGRFLDHVGESSLENSGGTLGEGGAMLLVHFNPVPGGFHTVQLHALIVDKGMERADRIRTSAYTRHHGIGEFASLLLHLNFNLLPHDTLEISHYRGERVGSHRTPNQVVRIPDVGHPIPHGFINRILQRALPILDRDNLGSQRIHSEHV
mmetsp:Transcript_27017/g.27387  ORF Transcript_27017/g.27387 Transcript_27017/m.27387 type:complete len:259 (-) Transcript_27017:858-1634(-)